MGRDRSRARSSVAAPMMPGRDNYAEDSLRGADIGPFKTITRAACSRGTARWQRAAAFTASQKRGFHISP